MRTDEENSPLTAAGIHKRFGKNTVLKDLDLELEPGLVTVLLGANGAGKSTLMRLALGTLKAEAGSMRVLGLNPLKQARKLRQQVGFVPDKPDAYAWMTLPGLLRLLRPQYPTWDEEQARKLIERLAVPTKTQFRSMSRGEGMKAMLVAALAPRPPFLLLDEPFAGLDPMAREEVLLGVIAELAEERRTVLCSTHDLELAARMADRIAILAQGRIQKHGPVDEVLSSKGEGRIPTKLHEALVSVLSEEIPSC